MDLFDIKYVYMDWDDKLKDKKVFVCDSLQFMREQINLDAFIARHVEDNGDCNSLCPFIDKNGTPWSLAYYDPNYECKVAYAEGKVIQVRNPTICAEWSDTDKPQWYSFCEYRVKPEESEPVAKPKYYVNKCSDDTLHINRLHSHFVYQSTEAECARYIQEHYCNKCAHESCEIKADTQFCKGFKNKQEPAKKKRRMTNRELAKWLADNNGQVAYVHSGFRCTEHSYTTDDDDPVSPSIQIRSWNETGWREPEVEE